MPRDFQQLTSCSVARRELREQTREILSAGPVASPLSAEVRRTDLTLLRWKVVEMVSRREGGPE